MSGTSEFERTLVRVYDTIAPKALLCVRAARFRAHPGPLDMLHRVTVSEEGDYHAEFEVTGVLTVTLVDPATVSRRGWEPSQGGRHDFWL